MAVVIPRFLYGSNPESIATQRNQISDNLRQEEAQAFAQEMARRQEEQRAYQFERQLQANEAMRRMQAAENQQTQQANIMLNLARMKESQKQNSIENMLRASSLGLTNQRNAQAENNMLFKNIVQSINETRGPVTMKQIQMAFPNLNPALVKTLDPMIAQHNYDQAVQGTQDQEAAALLNRPIDLQNDINNLMAEQSNINTPKARKTQIGLELEQKRSAAKIVADQVKNLKFDTSNLGVDPITGRYYVRTATNAAPATRNTPIIGNQSMGKPSRMALLTQFTKTELARRGLPDGAILPQDVRADITRRVDEILSRQ